jgi:hypothetical protein
MFVRKHEATSEQGWEVALTRLRFKILVDIGQKELTFV